MFHTQVDEPKKRIDKGAYPQRSIVWECYDFASRPPEDLNG